MYLQSVKQCDIHTAAPFTFGQCTVLLALFIGFKHVGHSVITLFDCDIQTATPLPLLSCGIISHRREVIILNNTELSHTLALEFVKNSVDFNKISPIDFLKKYLEVKDKMCAHLKEESDRLSSERVNKFLSV